MLATAQTIDFGTILGHLAVVLIVAKFASEAAERLKVPAVLGEILAGVLIGPSVLGLVEPSDSLRVLAEIGVIVLLANVGMETDLNELRRVGRAALTVAVIGVVVPMSAGTGAGLLLGENLDASVFLGAALAATSVGITARVFGDLRALASKEARIVLGAAVADDVLGLVILTVVTRVVEQGSIDPAGLATTVGAAVTFLVLSVGAGLLIVPRLLGRVGTAATSGATVGVVGMGLTFAFSAAAGSANLAPIIGAFVAGTALGRAPGHDRIERSLSSVGHVFIPVFFLQIGIDTDVTKFFQGHVIAVASVLTVVAVLGKVVAGLGAPRATTDRLLIGLGMVPRGEVGLIFASIGVSVGVFHDDLYAVVLLVVLLTTLVTPPLLRWRLSIPSAPERSAVGTEQVHEPAGGWITVSDGAVDLAAQPPDTKVLAVILDAAAASAVATPGRGLMDWIHETREIPLRWDAASTSGFMGVLRTGNARSWRLLEISGVLDRALPEMSAALQRRQTDSSELDPRNATHMATLETVRARIGVATDESGSLLLAALISDLDLTDSGATTMLERLTLPAEVVRESLAMLSASTLLRATVTSEPYVHSPRVMSQLAEFLRSPLTVEKGRILTESRGDLADWQHSLLLDTTTGVQALLAHPEIIAGEGESLESVTRRDALSLTSDPFVRDRIEHAATSYVISHDPATILRHAELVEPAPRRRAVRVNTAATTTPGEWTVDIATRDTRGLLARITRVLADRGLGIVAADLATWPDGAVLDTFVVRSPMRPDAATIAFDIERSLGRRVALPRGLRTGASNGLVLRLDNESHPWHSTVIVSGADQPGLLVAVSSAFARSNVRVHHARIHTDGGVVTDRFEVSDRLGRKIDLRTLARIESLLS